MPRTFIGISATIEPSFSIYHYKLLSGSDCYDRLFAEIKAAALPVLDRGFGQFSYLRIENWELSYLGIGGNSHI
jgi:hypothetical protein